MPARLAACFSLALALSAPGRPPLPADPMQDLQTAIPYGIKLLESKKHARFLKAFMEPEALKAAAKSGFDDFAKQFGHKHADALLSALKEARDAKPALQEGGKKAFFALKREINGNSSLVFRKHGTAWRIQQ